MPTLLKEHAKAETQVPKKYETNYTTETAPRDGKDLFLRIDVEDNAARIHCRASEKVGDHENRKVIFKANKACTLKFERAGVFGTNEYPLSAETKTPIAVVVPIGKTDWTYCEVWPSGMPKRSPTPHQSPPKIEVP